MRRWARLVILAGLAGVVGARAARAQSTTDALATVKIEKCRREPGRIVVTYRLEGALQLEDHNELESGRTIIFTHRIDVYRRRTFFADKWLARRTIETSASLDTLTEQYALTRRVDDGAVETQSTEKAPVMEKWLGEVRSLAVDVPADDSRGALEVRVKTQYRKGFLLFIWPRELTAVGDAECR